VNLHDHLGRFVAENFELDPSGFCSHSALLRCYFDWTSAHEIVNRRLPFLLLLLRIEERFGAKAKLAWLSEDRSRTLPGEYAQADGRVSSRAYVVTGLRFKHRELNQRPGVDARGPVSRVWQRVAEGAVPDTIEPVDLSDDEDLDEDDPEEQHRQRRRDYYARNKDRILEQKRAKKEGL
jgi:hypothetical protein